MKLSNYFFLRVSIVLLFTGTLSCKKKNNPTEPALVNLQLSSMEIDGKLVTESITRNVNRSPVIQLRFNAPLKKDKVAGAVVLNQGSALRIPISLTFKQNDSLLLITPEQPLPGLSSFQLSVGSTIESLNGNRPTEVSNLVFHTGIDSSDKFKVLTDDQLLDTVQRRTFAYFWEFGHPVSGLARERNSSGDLVTSGGSGFGLMTIPIAVERKFITRSEAIERVKKTVGFLKNTAQTFHGAFPHWLNGRTGAVIPFSAKDNGADLVETSYLMAGLLTVRSYFSGTTPDEINLQKDITAIWEAVEWSWFRKSGENVLYWHWSPNFGWDMNMKIQGWNECLITYVMAAASPSFGIPKLVYTQGFARNGSQVTNQNQYGFQLPLGPSLGGPLFFSHYSFLGINPFGLRDEYASYEQQVISHTKINRAYCAENPKKFAGYSNVCWGLTASDVPNGYAANAPGNDIGVISPTAAISSLPFTPQESMAALRFFYDKLGDKLWGEYGFADAFSIHELWFANSTLAIDQGPIVIMIENARSRLVWDLFLKNPEIKNGLRALGFTAPYL